VKKACLILVIAMACCSAEQFILLNQDITWTGGRFNGPFLGQSGASAWYDWTSPIDFTKGCIFSRVEVLEKPTDLQVEIQPCLWNSPPPGESCGSHGPIWSTTGVYYWRIDGPEYWWRKDGLPVDWSKPGTRSLLLIKSGTTLWVDQCGGAWCMGASAASHLPVKVHYEIVVTSTTDGTFVIPPELKDWDCNEVVKLSDYWDCEGGGTQVVARGAQAHDRTHLEVGLRVNGGVEIRCEKPGLVNIFGMRGERVAQVRVSAKGTVEVPRSTFAGAGTYVARLTAQGTQPGSRFVVY